jgi:hypothetical protein
MVNPAQAFPSLSSNVKVESEIRAMSPINKFTEISSSVIVHLLVFG